MQSIAKVTKFYLCLTINQMKSRTTTISRNVFIFWHDFDFNPLSSRPVLQELHKSEVSLKFFNFVQMRGPKYSILSHLVTKIDFRRTKRGPSRDIYQYNIEGWELIPHNGTGLLNKITNYAFIQIAGSSCDSLSSSWWGASSSTVVNLHKTINFIDISITIHCWRFSVCRVHLEIFSSTVLGDHRRVP